MASNDFIILVHGGADEITEPKVEAKLDGVRNAVRAACQKYEEANNILDATQAAIEYMEADPMFNCGYGSVLTIDGDIEMDALIMDGKDLRAGAVTGIQNVLHPISVARLVLDNSPHVLLAGVGAQQFAKKMNIPFDPTLKTSYAREELDKFKANGKNFASVVSGGTVGAVGIDGRNNVVACVSTGGLTGKMKGRVGDSPIPGSGAAADNKIGAVSCTGYGEAIMKYSVSQRILLAMEAGQSAQEATEYVLKGMLERIGKTAGAITVSNDYDVGIAFTAPLMPWAYFHNGKMRYGIRPGEKYEENRR